MFTDPVGDDETHARGHEGGLLLCNAAVSKQRVAQEGPFKRLFQLCLHTTGPEIQERFPASRAAILDVTSWWISFQLLPCIYLLMRAYLEMQNGSLSALICNIPSNLAPDESLVDVVWHVGIFIWDLMINFFVIYQESVARRVRKITSEGIMWYLMKDWFANNSACSPLWVCPKAVRIWWQEYGMRSG